MIGFLKSDNYTTPKEKLIQEFLTISKTFLFDKTVTLQKGLIFKYLVTTNT